MAPVDDKVRCPWLDTSKDYYVKYHDEEWGVAVYDDRQLFEMLILEGAQAGLSWDSVLKKREGYRKAFDDFDVQKIVNYSEAKLEELRQDPGIIRNRLKIKSAVVNGRVFLEIQKEFGSFSKYLWGFVGGKPIINAWRDLSEVPVSTAESDALSKDLKKRGMKFVGSVIIYAYMQAVGMVQDHTVDCFRYNELK